MRFSSSSADSKIDIFIRVDPPRSHSYLMMYALPYVLASSCMFAFRTRTEARSAVISILGKRTIAEVLERISVRV